MAKILVIEDAHALRKDILEMLTFEGFEVQEAENGAVGVQIARSYHPDLIICDIMMPELNGYEVLDELRAEPETSMIPFIFLTAKTDKTDIRTGMSSGADDYLTKPFKTIELLSTIRARLRRRHELNDYTERKLNRLRQNIITALPHELRTPLNTILGFSDMLITDSTTITPENIEQWGTHIHEAAQRLYELIENYIAYAKIETLARNAEGDVIQLNPVMQPRMVIEYEAMQKAYSFNREQDLHLDVTETETVAIGEDDLRKIVDELIDNAFRYSEANRLVEVRTTVEGDDYVLLVRDQGRGMDPDQLTMIGAYMQYERWLHEQQGAGLGLTIARRLVELHKGRVDIRSKVDEGTEVEVRLPLNANGR